MLPPLATVEALEEWLGEAIPGGADTTRAEAYLVAASNRVRSFTRRDWLLEDDEPDGSTPAIDADDLDLVATSVVVPAAARMWANPSGLLQESAGPFSGRFPEAAARGVYLTEDELAALGPFCTAARPKLWTQRTTRDDGSGPDTRTVFVDVTPAGEPMPFMDRDEPW